jgi:hypothetical protein
MKLELDEVDSFLANFPKTGFAIAKRNGKSSKGTVTHYFSTEKELNDFLEEEFGEKNDHLSGAELLKKTLETIIIDCSKANPKKLD